MFWSLSIPKALSALTLHIASLPSSLTRPLKEESWNPYAPILPSRSRSSSHSRSPTRTGTRRRSSRISRSCAIAVGLVGFSFVLNVVFVYWYCFPSKPYDGLDDYSQM